MNLPVRLKRSDTPKAALLRQMEAFPNVAPERIIRSVAWAHNLEIAKIRELWPKAKRIFEAKKNDRRP